MRRPVGGMVMLDACAWRALIDAARSRLAPRTISPFVDAGGVSAAILTDSDHIYTGVCIDTACSLGMCAERAAIANMITCGEHRVAALVCIMGNGACGSPCGACRELLMQLDGTGADIEILTDLESLSSIRLGDLVPDWWGRTRFEG